MCQRLRFGKSLAEEHGVEALGIEHGDCRRNYAERGEKRQLGEADSCEGAEAPEDEGVDAAVGREKIEEAYNRRGRIAKQDAYYEQYIVRFYHQRE